jgi:hypothetical protein
MRTYYKIWFKPGVVSTDGKIRTAGLFEITSETDHMLAARKVDKFGDDDSTLKGGVVIERVHVIHKSAIRRRQVWVMNNHYGELEPVKTERRSRVKA